MTIALFILIYKLIKYKHLKVYIKTTKLHMTVLCGYIFTKKFVVDAWHVRLKPAEFDIRAQVWHTNTLTLVSLCLCCCERNIICVCCCQQWRFKVVERPNSNLQKSVVCLQNSKTKIILHLLIIVLPDNKGYYCYSIEFERAMIISTITRSTWLSNCPSSVREYILLLLASNFFCKTVKVIFAIDCQILEQFIVTQQ